VNTRRGKQECSLENLPVSVSCMGLLMNPGPVLHEDCLTMSQAQIDKLTSLKLRPDQMVSRVVEIILNQYSEASSAAFDGKFEFLAQHLVEICQKLCDILPNLKSNQSMRRRFAKDVCIRCDLSKMSRKKRRFPKRRVCELTSTHRKSV